MLSMTPKSNCRRAVFQEMNSTEVTRGSPFPSRSGIGGKEEPTGQTRLRHLGAAESLDSGCDDDSRYASPESSRTAENTTGS